MAVAWLHRGNGALRAEVLRVVEGVLHREAGTACWTAQAGRVAES